MGLPTQYHHPEYGLCVTLYAAMAHLEALNIPYQRQKDTLHITRADGQTIAVTPVILPVGKMYVIRVLEGQDTDA